ncbi:hypothetical protein [Actinoplanes sp. NPDC049681]|uniref:hypothetical protein n=1 Tax=Actinoplanes sp. NPDC049681 TaxID=3363905 RepID=UPI0037B006E3
MARCATVEEVLAAVEKLGATRGQLGFAIDGAVVKSDSAADRQRTGSSSRAPRATPIQRPSSMIAAQDPRDRT